MLSQVDIYTDGACRGNPGPGGWGVLMRYNGTEKSLYGGEKDTTNNRMEITAVLNGIKDFLKLAYDPRTPDVDKADVLCINSDSKYLLDGIETWCENWAKHDWARKNGKTVLNQDLWKQIYHLKDKVNLEFNFIKGHTGDPHNEECDRLAVEAIKRKSGTQFESSKSEMVAPEEPPDWSILKSALKATFVELEDMFNAEPEDRELAIISIEFVVVPVSAIPNAPAVELS